MANEELEKYKLSLERSRTQFRILEEKSRHRNWVPVFLFLYIHLDKVFSVEILVRIKEKYWHFYRTYGIVSVYMKKMKKWENTYVGDILCAPW